MRSSKEQRTWIVELLFKNIGSIVAVHRKFASSFQMEKPSKKSIIGTVSMFKKSFSTAEKERQVVQKGRPQFCIACQRVLPKMQYSSDIKGGRSRKEEGVRSIILRAYSWLKVYFALNPNPYGGEGGAIWPTPYGRGSQPFSNCGPLNAWQFCCGPPRVSNKLSSGGGRG